VQVQVLSPAQGSFPRNCRGNSGLWCETNGVRALYVPTDSLTQAWLTHILDGFW